MRRQWLRASCVFLILAVLIASAYRFLAIEQQLTLEVEEADAYERLSWMTASSLADLRTSQQAYVAAGQDLNVWIKNTEKEFQKIEIKIEKLQELSLTPESIEELHATRVTLDRLRRIDGMAKKHALDGQALMASDLVFADGGDLSRRAGKSLELARNLEHDAYTLKQNEQRQMQATTLVAASVVTILVAILLFPISPGKSTSSGTVSGLSTAENKSTLELPNSKEIAPVSTKLDSVIPNLKLAAEVCTDLGRVSDGTKLNGILARAGQVLNSSNLIVWICDESGTALRAVLGHGYTEKQLSQLGRVSCESDNVTASAYRTGQLQTMPSDENFPGAIAVPILASSQKMPAVGVLSVEVEQGWETSEAVQATVLMLAAQLATIVTADPVRTSTDVEKTAQETHAVG